MGVFQNNLMGAAAAAASAGGGDFYSHQIANSARFTGSGRLTKTAGTPTNIDKFTISFWVKRSDVTAQNNMVFGDTSNINYQRLGFNSSEKLELHEQRGAGDSNGLRTVDQVFRDPSAWQHIVWVYDSGNSTEADREIFYVNGTRLTDVEGWDGGYPSQNRDSVFNQSGATQVIGGASAYYGSYLNGYMAEVVFNDGQAYAGSDYGETKNGVWIPKDPSGLTFGNNGFYLKFESSSDMGNDSSGNNNDFTASGIGTHDQMLDSPTFNSSSNGGNFATLNALTLGSYGTLSEGNLRANGNSTDGSYMASTMAFKTGKWYMEFLCVAQTEGWPYVSILDYANTAFSTTTGMEGWAIRYQADDDLEVNTGDSISNFGTITLVATGLTTYTDGDIIGIHLDCDNKKVWFSKNGSFSNSGDPSAGTNPQATWTGTPTIAFMGATYNNNDYIMNFGQDGTFAGEKTAQGNSDDTGYGNFYYAPDTGFLAMCAGNLPLADAINPAETDDDYPQELFNTIIYTGDNGGSFTTGFQPDLVWVKRRDGDQSNGLWDSSRGTTKILISNEQDAEGTSSGLTSFDSTGYTMGTYYNQTGNTYVSWSWRANGGSSSNSDGATSSTVQAAPGGGFSIVTYTGFAGASGTSTVGHGMGVAPNMIIYKSRSRGSGWWTAAPGLFSSQSHFIDLNGTGQPTDLSSYGTMSAPTTSVFSINGVDGVGGESATYVAYCFANIEGFCKVGTYAGNGSTDGAFIYTGFKPKFILFKRTNRSGDFWYIIDPVRNPFNGPGSRLLNADRGVGESGNATTDVIDIVSNGFKMRTSGSGINGSGGEWIWLAMAHNPFKYATAR
jgi:hypothetical protein